MRKRAYDQRCMLGEFEDCELAQIGKNCQNLLTILNAKAFSGNPRILSYYFHIKTKGDTRMIQTTIRLPEKLYKELKEEAKRRGLTFNALVLIKIGT